jgi:hypothetical protein
VTLDYLFNDGKSDARSRVIIARVEALKYGKNPFCVLYVNTDPVVAHRKHPAVFRFLYANVNHRGIIAPKLYRIA